MKNIEVSPKLYKYTLEEEINLRPRILYLLPFVLMLAHPGHTVGDPYKKMAKEIVHNIKKSKKPRLGILAFPYHDGRISSGSSIISERLTTHLVSFKSLRVVERRLISKLLEEQHMNETGVIDPQTAQKLGQVLGVDIIVTGTLIELNDNETEINARCINANSGEVISAAHSKVQTVWKDRPRFPRSERADRDNYNHPEEVKKPVEDDEPIKVGIPGPRPYYGGYGNRGYR